MDINWTTLVLEIINFLVLVWLLKRFFYQPVKDVIERRQQQIEAQLAQADEQLQHAEALRSQYEGRLADWQQEREDMLHQLFQEMEGERQGLKAALDQELEKERQKAAVLAERGLQEQRRQMEKDALAQGAQFVARLLEELASPEVQHRLVEHLLAELSHLGAKRQELLRVAAAEGAPVEVVSAYPLRDEQRLQLEQCLNSLVDKPVQLEFLVDSTLLAGLLLTIGPWVLHANLHDELKTFADIAYER